MSPMPTRKTKPPSMVELEGRLRALEEMASHLDARLQKLEVVRTPSPTTTEPAPEEPQLPETE